LRLQGTWTDKQMDGQGDSYIPPKLCLRGGYNKNWTGCQKSHCIFFCRDVTSSGKI